VRSFGVAAVAAVCAVRLQFALEPSVAEDGFEYSYDGDNVVATPTVHRASSGLAMECLMLPACRENRPPSADGSTPGHDLHCLGAVSFRGAPRARSSCGPIPGQLAQERIAGEPPRHCVRQ
jgi:hypothetical protein